MPANSIKWAYTAKGWRAAVYGSNFGASAMFQIAVVRCCQRIALSAAVLLSVGDPAAAANDYPTSALADYVFGCMAGNGQTQEMLQKCSCSIDVISSLVSYEEYVQAETVLRMVQQPGEAAGVFRDSPWTKSVVEDLRRAQAEAEIRCF
jgi:hypothetical protein